MLGLTKHIPMHMGMLVSIGQLLESTITHKIVIV